MKPKELTPDQLGNRETIRANSFNSEQIIKIALDKIVIRKGFNVRTDMGDIDGLAASIVANGQSLPGRVDILEDGTFALADGHRRFLALQQITDKTGDECFFMAVVNKTKTTEEQRILQMFTTQDNKPLNPVEVADLIQRLVNLGHSQKNIAEKIGKTPSYVGRMLEFATESPAIKEHVKNGKLNITTAINQRKQTPDTQARVDKIDNAVNASDKSIDVSRALKSDAASKKNKADIIATKIAREILADEKIQTEARLVEIIIRFL